MLYEIGSNGMVPLSSAGKDNLEIGRVIYFNGYNNDSYVICKNLGVDKRWGYGAYYEAVNLSDSRRQRFEAATLKWISEKKDNRIATYITDQILSAEEVLDAWQKSEAKILVDQAEKQKEEQAKKDGLAMLPSMYPKLLTVANSGGKSGAAVGALNLKKELQEAFPGVKFSVKSEYYAGGCSIRVGWKNGPTDPQVDAIADKYQYGDFDGMTDSYDYRNEIFTDVFGGAKYVSCSRTLTNESYDAVAIELGFVSAKFNSKTGCFDGIDYETTEMIRRAAWKKDFYTNGGIAA